MGTDFNQPLPLPGSYQPASPADSFDVCTGLQTPVDVVMIDIDLLLTWGATYKKLEPGEIIFREGTEGHFYHQVVSGSVHWLNVDDEGSEFLQEIIGPGESFGEFPLFDGQPYAATAVAGKESVVIRLSKHTFLQLLHDNPCIHMSFTRLLTERLRFKFLLLKELSCANPEHRIATLFDHFKKARKNICSKCNRVNITRQQIADMTGLRVETVIRSIRNLQEKGTVVITKGKVYC